jgi:hypothetical protein
MIIIATLSIIIAIVGLPLLILYIGGFWEESDKGDKKHVLYDPKEHKEYHIYGTCIFSAKCVHPRKDYYKFDVKIFELTDSYFVYLKEDTSQRVIREIAKLVDDPSEEAIENGLVTKEGKLTRAGLVEEILDPDLISSPTTITREAIVPVMWKKKFIEPSVEIKN